MHLVQCGELDRSFEWLEDFGKLLNTRLQMNREDRVYGTMNNGEIMPKGLRIFYAVLFKKWWLGYTTQNKENVRFSDRAAWLASVKRLHMIIHSFEIESIKRFESLHRNMHVLLGFTPEQKQKAIDGETARRNNKLAPLGEVDVQGKITLAFKWKDLREISNAY